MLMSISMSSNVRIGKSSIPGSGSIQAILEMLQVQNAGQAALTRHSPIKTIKIPKRAIPYSRTLESIAGPTISHGRYWSNMDMINFPRPIANLIRSAPLTRLPLITNAQSLNVILGCHGMASTSPQNWYHTTAYRCGEARCQVLRPQSHPSLSRRQSVCLCVVKRGAPDVEGETRYPCDSSSYAVVMEIEIRDCTVESECVVMYQQSAYARRQGTCIRLLITAVEERISASHHWNCVYTEIFGWQFINIYQCYDYSIAIYLHAYRTHSEK